MVRPQIGPIFHFGVGPGLLNRGYFHLVPRQSTSEKVHPSHSSRTNVLSSLSDFGPKEHVRLREYA